MRARTRRNRQLYSRRDVDFNRQLSSRIQSDTINEHSPVSVTTGAKTTAAGVVSIPISPTPFSTARANVHITTTHDEQSYPHNIPSSEDTTPAPRISHRYPAHVRMHTPSKRTPIQSWRGGQRCSCGRISAIFLYMYAKMSR